jgi:hypothetical protein
MYGCVQPGAQAGRIRKQTLTKDEATPSIRYGHRHAVQDGTCAGEQLDSQMRNVDRRECQPFAGDAAITGRLGGLAGIQWWMASTTAAEGFHYATPNA